MPLFTVEVAGRPIVVFSKEDRQEAAEIVTALIAPDLMEFEEDGRPIWDGNEPISMRAANEDEVAEWEQGFAESMASDGTAEQGTDGYAVFLIEVDEDMDAG